MDVAPSMVQRSGDTLIVRSVVSGNEIYLDQETGNLMTSRPPAAAFQCQPQPQQQHMQDSDIQSAAEHLKDEGLPQCKIKRNYSCSYCTYFTQNPRSHLTHLRDVHGEKIVINKCKLCLYASRHYQKLVRHMKMVHGSTEGIAGNHGQSRKRNINREARKRKNEDDESLRIALTSTFQTIRQLQLQKQQEQEQQQQQPLLQHYQMPKRESPPVPVDDAPQNRLLKCSVCEWTTLYRAQLVDHEQEKHCRTKFFRCDKCTYVTHIKARYSKHVKYHSMPMIKCVTCDFRTPYKWNLDRHMKNHGGVGPFKCAACDFTADIKQSLTVHEMNHHVPPVGHAAGMSLARRRNKVGGTDISDDYLSDPGDQDDQFNNNNNNIDDFDESYAKKCKYEMPDEDDDDEEQPTDLSQKGGSEVGSQHNQKKSVRPVPNLIPIQAATNALNLSKEPAPSRNRIKDIAALLFTESQYADIVMQMEKADAAQLSPSSNHSAASKRKAPSSSFFHELKAFTDESARNGNLSCSCGHVSKCLSESYIHRKSCNFSSEEKHSSISPINLTVNCSGSTRCQFCRHRCKSSADLLNHLKNCPDTGRCQNDSFDSMSMSGGSSGGRQEHDDDGAGSEDMNKHPMENRVFVWNKMPGMSDGGGGSGGGGSGSCGGGSADGANGSGSSKSDVNGNLDAKNVLLMGGSSGGSSGVGNGGKNEDNSYYGVETAPGYGEVTKKMTPEEEAANSSLKKVYKCPHCSFWASTASRFHVHIVGHLNKKPFECSLCAYRSNWRWDITKHIRLKTIRDPSHKNARVLMNDETGRRNYTKYNKYITLMKVTDEDGDPKLMKSGEMTPNQVATLSFLNDFNKTASESGLVNGLKSNHSQDGDSSRDRQLQQLNQKNDIDSSVDTNGFGNLPLLLMNVAMAQKEQQEQAAAAASAGSIKRSPPPLIKPSDDLITDIKTDGLEKKKLYKCRKCNFRHANRDAALAHVKVHCQDPLMSFPSPSKPNHSTPLQVAVNSNNIYQLAMCLSQNQLMQEQKSPGGSSSNNNTQHSNLSPAISGSGLQQAISPKAFAAIQAAGTTIEHGEITDEASSSIVGESTSACGGVTPPPSSTVVQATSNPTAINSTSTSAPTASNTPPTATTTTTGGTSSFIGGASNSTTVVMGVTTSSNFCNDSNERREPSPFRCGHCHQVSNWKHVIQRHCRLKHSGNVLIETLDRNSNSTLYRPLGPAGNGQSCHVLGPTADPYILGGIKANHQQSLGSNKNTNSMLSKDDSPSQADSPFSLSRQKFRRDQLMGSTENLRMPLDGNSPHTMKNTVLRKEDDLTANDLPNSLSPMYAFNLLINNNERARIALSNNNNDNSVLSKDDSHPQGDSPYQRYRCELPSPQSSSSYNSPSNKCKQQKCPSCPYICDSKSQMNYHISLHKPTQYECNLCSYVCTKRQHLNNHMKAMHENCGPFTNEPPAAIDLRSKQSHDSDDDELASKVIAYCPKCPTRFVDSPKELQLHLNAHGACYDIQCEACDFSTKQEAVLLSHSFAHTSTYQEKTEQIAKSAREDPNYVARKLQQITLPKTGATVWVVAEAREQSSSFDGDGSLLKKQLETGSIKEFTSPASSASPGSSSPSESGELEKCTHCPFQSTCSDTFKRHLQCHISVSNQTEKHTCEHCDFSTSSEETLAEHTQIHFESIEGRKSVAFFTSYDQLELIVTDDEAKKDEAPKPINFNNTTNDSKASSEPEKSEKDSASPNLRRSSRSSAHNGEGGKSSSSSSPPPPPPPPPSSHKTILVNPKTGQVIRRN